MSEICLHCTNLPGCKLLISPSKKFSLELVITPESDSSCHQFSPVTPRLQEVREHLFESTGAGCLRVFHRLPAIVSEDLLKAEQEEEYVMNETPDLASIIMDEMTVDERREQLLNMTNDNGEIILEEDGKPIVRPTYELRNFAVSPDYHVQLSRDVGMFRSTNQVVDDIIKKELELGLIIKNTKSGKPKASKPAPKVAKAKEKPVAGKKVIVRNRKSQTAASTKGSDEGGGGKSISRPRRTTGPKTTKSKEADTSTTEATAPSDVGDIVPAIVEAVMQQVVPEIVSQVSQVVEKRIGEVKAELEGQLDNNLNTTVDVVTILHDIIVQIVSDVNANVEGLNLDGYEQMFAEEGKILSYVDQAGEGGN